VEGSLATAKKKISLLDYFYVKVLISASSRLILQVQSPSPTTRIALCYRQEEHLLAHGGSLLFGLL